MKYVFLSLVIVFSISGCCGQKSCGVSDKEYQRSNNASEKSLQQLDAE